MNLSGKRLTSSLAVRLICSVRTLPNQCSSKYLPSSTIHRDSHVVKQPLINITRLINLYPKESFEILSDAFSDTFSVHLSNFGNRADYYRNKSRSCFLSLKGRSEKAHWPISFSQEIIQRNFSDHIAYFV